MNENMREVLQCAAEAEGPTTSRFIGDPGIDDITDIADKELNWRPNQKERLNVLRKTQVTFLIRSFDF